jgi:hypothetical protein
MGTKVEETLPSIYQSRQRVKLLSADAMFGYQDTSTTLDLWTSAEDFGRNVPLLTQAPHGLETDVA